MGANAPASAREALEMVRAGLGYLAAADAAQLATVTQAECLRELEQADAVATAARASILAGFTAGQGYSGDAAYSAVSWLIHRTGITRGAAAGHTAWAKRTATHPRVLAALAAGQVPESVGRLICVWTDKLPDKARDEADEALVAAGAGGLGLEELAALFAEMYERARSERPDEDPGRDFADRGVKLAATFGGAGLFYGDLTRECAEVVGRVLDALGGKAGKDDDRSKQERYHDALQEAMRRLVVREPGAGAGRAAGEGLGAHRAGGPAAARRRFCLAGAVDRAGPGPVGRPPRSASEAGASDGAWLDGDAAEAIACDAAMAPIVTGDVNVDALEGLVRLCVELDRVAAPATARARRLRTPRRPGRRSSKRSSARRSTCCPGRAGWRRSCAAGSSGRGWAGRACRWTSGTPSRSRRGSATR